MENNKMLSAPAGADPARASNIQTVGTFWSSACAELAPIRDDLARMYREAGAAGIMEQRALGLGVMVGYLESLMSKTPSRISELGSLYGKLVESERRAYEAHRKHRKTKDANPDLASMA